MTPVNRLTYIKAATGAQSRHMSFHNQLRDDETLIGVTVPVTYAIGLFGMVCNFVGNVQQTYEMYPLFLDEKYKKNTVTIFFLHIPASFVFSVISDLCLIVYPIIINDYVVISYASVNIVVILFVMIKISRNFLPLP